MPSTNDASAGHQVELGPHRVPRGDGIGETAVELGEADGTGGLAALGRVGRGELVGGGVVGRLQRHEVGRLRGGRRTQGGVVEDGGGRGEAPGVVVDGGLQLGHPLVGKGGLQRGLQVGEAGLDRGGLDRETGAVPRALGGRHGAEGLAEGGEQARFGLVVGGQRGHVGVPLTERRFELGGHLGDPVGELGDGGVELGQAQGLLLGLRGRSLQVGQRGRLGGRGAEGRGGLGDRQVQRLEVVAPGDLQRQGGLGLQVAGLRRPRVLLELGVVEPLAQRLLGRRVGGVDGRGREVRVVLGAAHGAAAAADGEPTRDLGRHAVQPRLLEGDELLDQAQARRRRPR